MESKALNEVSKRKLFFGNSCISNNLRNNMKGCTDERVIITLLCTRNEVYVNDSEGAKLARVA